MKNHHIITLLFIFATLYFFFGSQDNNKSCRPKGRILQSNGDISLPASSFTIENYFNIHFDIDSTDITMVIQCTNPGRYFAIVFATQMARSDMWVFTLNSGQIIAEDYYGTGYFTPPTDTSGGGTNDLTVLGYEITSSYSLVKVKRALNTGDSRDYGINEGNTGLIFATGPSNSLVNHGPTRGYVNAPLINGVKGIVLKNDSSTKAEDVHGIINIIAWAVLVDIAILVARYLRGIKFVIGSFTITAHIIHSALMWVTFILSTAMTILLLARKGKSVNLLNGEGKHDFHVVNGFVILALSALAVAIGGFSFFLMKGYKDTVSAKVFQYLKWIHLGLGFLLYLLTKVNIIIGAIFYDQGNWQVPVFVYLGVLLLIHVLFQFMHPKLFKCLRKIGNSSSKAHHSSQQHHVNLLKAINNGTPLAKILSDFPNVKWVQIGNNVYDLSNWVHPGGNFIIEACLGREVGRYLYGNYALEGTTIKPHKHSNLALSQMQKFYIGEVTSSESILVRKNTKDQTQATNSHTWKIVSVKPVSNTVSKIHFTSEDFNVKTFGSSLSFLGRHFKVSFNQENAIARQYTTALSLAEMNTQFRQDAYEYFTKIMAGQNEASFSNKSSFQTVTDSLPLFIKKYPFQKAFSKAIHEVDITGSQNELRIEGPIGRGLDLTAGSTGTHTIICAGTGVLPFIDFLNFFLFKTMYQTIKDKAGVEKAEEINVSKTPFDNILEGLNVNFVGSFENENEVLGLDIIQKLAEISKKHKIDNFKAMVKGYGDENIVKVNEFFSKDFIEKNVTLQGSKYYIVGPPKFNAQISRDLASLGVGKDTIVLV